MRRCLVRRDACAPTSRALRVLVLPTGQGPVCEKRRFFTSELLIAATRDTYWHVQCMQACLSQRGGLWRGTQSEKPRVTPTPFR